MSHHHQASQGTTGQLGSKATSNAVTTLPRQEDASKYHAFALDEQRRYPEIDTGVASVYGIVHVIAYFILLLSLISLAGGSLVPRLLRLRVCAREIVCKCLSASGERGGAGEVLESFVRKHE
jgi:hypothetical protein